MIEGVKITKLTKLVDDRGYLMEILRSDDADFQRFGQVYVTVCLPGMVKAWHLHRRQTDYFCIIRGAAKIGLYDGREGSPTYRQTQTVYLSELESCRLQIPPGVWHGQMALGGEPCYLLNVPTELYNYQDPDEVRRDPFDNDFGYDWLPKSR